MLDNLSTHTTPDVAQWLTDNPHVSFHFTPIDLRDEPESDLIRIIPGNIRCALPSVKVVITARSGSSSLDADAQPFAWTATTDEILAKVALTQTNIRQLVTHAIHAS